jgi:hypothetical protein
MTAFEIDGRWYTWPPLQFMTCGTIEDLELGWRVICWLMEENPKYCDEVLSR